MLPDAKKSENDVVVFLDQNYACECEQETQQRAAVAALHRIAGNRSLERTLPPQYVEMWKALGEKAKVIEERARRNEERQRRDREMKARAQKKELRGQGPTQVVMTDVHRAVIEGILQDAKRSGRSDESGRSDDEGVERDPSNAWDRSNGAAARVEELVTELETLGFSSQDAALAASKRDELSSALDWLCLNIPEDRLPSEFAASGAAGKPVTVIQWNGERAAGGPKQAAEVVDPAVVELERYGYGREESVKALESHRGDVSSSAVSLFLSMGSSTGHAGYFGAEGDYGRESPAPTGDAVVEERMALEAIFGDAVTFSGNCVDVCLTTTGDDGGDDAPMMTTVRLILPPTYPDTCPVVIVESSMASGARMKHLMTAIVLPGLVATRGAPAVHEIATLVGDSMIDLPEDDFEVPNICGAVADEEPQDIVAEGPTARAGIPSRPRRSSRPQHGSLSPAQARQESERLSAQYSKLKNDASNERLMKQRRSLPAASMRHEVIQAVGGSAVTIIMGSTGCGKSTQVPQFILEDAIEQSRGGQCNIICTQPRRISAIGLATRVAQERAESVGSTVGYSVRLDSKQSRQTRLLFCTTGVMLRRLLGDPELKSITHVVLDEVHERSIESDLLLFLLRDLLRTGKNPNVKIILMSATADAQLFAGYFSTSRMSAPPIISIPGFTHPVRDCFLEGVLELAGYQVGKTSKWAKKSVKGEDALVERYKAAGYSDSTARSMAVVDESAINVDLIEALVCTVLKQNAVDGNPRKPNNAILIFVPGGY